MSRLPRPHIPDSIKVKVALRQIGYVDPDDYVEYHKSIGQTLKVILAEIMADLATNFGCEVSDLHLDHDPALENREKLIEMPNGRRQRTVVVPEGAKVLRYFPDANDPAYLLYRPHGAQFAGSHDVKTRIRGDRGQHSDAGLARKNKRIKKNRDPKRRKAKIPQRKNPWPKGRKFRSHR